MYWIIFTPASPFIVCYNSFYLPNPSHLCNLIFFKVIPLLQFLLFIYSWMWVYPIDHCGIVRRDTTKKKIELPFLKSPPLSIAPHLVVELMNGFPLQGGMVSRLILGRQAKLL